MSLVSGSTFAPQHQHTGHPRRLRNESEKATVLTLEMDFLYNRRRASFLTRAKCEDAEVELVDPQEELREECKKAHCVDLETKLETCNARVSSRKNTEETCYEELLDLFHCIDHCVSKTLFSKLK